MGKYSPWLAGRKRTLWIALSMAVLSMLILVACGGATAATSTPTAAPTVAPTPTPTTPATQPTSVVVVEMLENPPGHYFFQPAALTITAGTTVVWFNGSDAPHTVTSDPTAPTAFGTTSNVTAGKTFGLIFNTPGTYHYHCTIHPKTMQATITVTAAS
jgi:plastocyanin